jgi:hypothetical protein
VLDGAKEELPIEAVTEDDEDEPADEPADEAEEKTPVVKREPRRPFD